MHRKKLRLLLSVSNPLTIQIHYKMEMSTRRSWAASDYPETHKEQHRKLELELSCSTSNEKQNSITDPMGYGELGARKANVTLLLSQKPHRLAPWWLSLGRMVTWVELTLRKEQYLSCKEAAGILSDSWRKELNSCCSEVQSMWYTSGGTKAGEPSPPWRIKIERHVSGSSFGMNPRPSVIAH